MEQTKDRPAWLLAFGRNHRQPNFRQRGTREKCHTDTWVQASALGLEDIVMGKFPEFRAEPSSCTTWVTHYSASFACSTPRTVFDMTTQTPISRSPWRERAMIQPRLQGTVCSPMRLVTHPEAQRNPESDVNVPWVFPIDQQGGELLTEWPC